MFFSASYTHSAVKPREAAELNTFILPYVNRVRPCTLQNLSTCYKYILIGNHALRLSMSPDYTVLHYDGIADNRASVHPYAAEQNAVFDLS